jgi:hypothetical protein
MRISTTRQDAVLRTKAKLRHAVHRAVGALDDRYGAALKKEVLGSRCRTLLDVGCGPHSPIEAFSSQLAYSVGIDRYAPYLRCSQRSHIHDDYLLIDAMEIAAHFYPGQFDCVLASDVIEHLPKKESLKLILMMERIAGKKVILFTPNGFVAQNMHDSNPYSVHRCGWEVGELMRLGFSVTGMNGWKCLRQERGVIARRPVLFWHAVSMLSQRVTARYPKHAFQLLCVKDVDPAAPRA